MARKDEKKKRRATDPAIAPPPMTRAEAAAIRGRSRPFSTDRDFEAARRAPRNATATQARGGDAGSIAAFRAMERGFGNRSVTPAGGYTPGPGKGLLSILAGMLPTPGAAPAPVQPAEAAAPAADPMNDFMNMELASLGGGPDRGTYVRPFEEAEGRARETYTQALPVIASAYDTLRQQLTSGQQGFAAEQAQIAAEQQARHGQLADRVRQLQGPAGADLAAQSGGQAAPSLTAGVQAQASQNEANLADAQRRQASFLENLARTGEQSAAARLQSTYGAQTAASGNAASNLNNILSQLGVQRANAEARYNSDATSHARQVAGTKISYMKEAAKARQDEAKAAEAAAKDEEKAYKRAITTNAPVYDFARNHSYLKGAPATRQAFIELMGKVKESGDLGRSQALGLLSMRGDALQKPDENGAYPYGKPISPEFLRKMIDEYYSQEDKLVRPYLG